MDNEFDSDAMDRLSKMHNEDMMMREAMNMQADLQFDNLMDSIGAAISLASNPPSPVSEYQRVPWSEVNDLARQGWKLTHIDFDREQFYMERERPAEA